MLKQGKSRDVFINYISNLCFKFRNKRATEKGIQNDPSHRKQGYIWDVHLDLESFYSAIFPPTFALLLQTTDTFQFEFTQLHFLVIIIEFQLDFHIFLAQALDRKLGFAGS